MNSSLLLSDQFRLNHQKIWVFQTKWLIFSAIDWFDALDVGHPYHTDGITCMAISPDSAVVLTGSKDHNVHMVNISSGKVWLASFIIK